MRCDEIRRFSDLYIDGEFEEREKALFEGHLQECEKCREEVAAWLSFRRAIRAKMAEQPAVPEDVRERLLASINKAQRVQDRTVWHRVAGAVGGLALVVGLGYMVSQTRPESSPEMESLIAESVANHEASLPPEVEGSVANIIPVLNRWMENPPLPPLREDKMTHLQGVRLTRVGKKPAILYRYLHQGRSISVLQVPHPGPVGGPLRPKSVDAPKLVYDGARDGLNVTLYETTDYTTSVVSDAPQPRIQFAPASL